MCKNENNIPGDIEKMKTRKKCTKQVKTPEEIWDEKCEKAAVLFNQGEEYPNIAKKVGCHVSNLYKELKKRGLFKMP